MYIHVFGKVERVEKMVVHYWATVLREAGSETSEKREARSEKRGARSEKRKAGSGKQLHYSATVSIHLHAFMH